MRALCCVEPDATCSPTEQVQQTRPGPLHLLFCDAAQRTPTCPSRPSSYIPPLLPPSHLWAPLPCLMCIPGPPPSRASSRPRRGFSSIGLNTTVVEMELNE